MSAAGTAARPRSGQTARSVLSENSPILSIPGSRPVRYDEPAEPDHASPSSPSSFSLSRPGSRPGPSGSETRTSKLRSAVVAGWTSAITSFSSIELENKGSVARDHLALERTFLAWVRTSLGFASIGIAITQLFRLNSTIAAPSTDPTDDQAGFSAASVADAQLRRVGKPLGATFLAVAVATLIVGFQRYFESQHYVMNGRFPAARGSVVILSFAAGSLIIGSLAVVLAVGRRTFEI